MPIKRTKFYQEFSQECIIKNRVNAMIFSNQFNGLNREQLENIVMEQQQVLANELPVSDNNPSRNCIEFSLDTLEQIKKRDVLNRQKQLLIQINSHKERAKSAVNAFNKAQNVAVKAASERNLTK